MKRYEVEANTKAPYSYEKSFEDFDLLVFNPEGNTFIIIEEEFHHTYTTTAESYKEALEKLIAEWYPSTYEEWTEDADGDMSPCGTYRKAVEYYTITEHDTTWTHERI